LTTLLNDALNEKVTITENGRRRRITKREAVIKQLVNKSASAEARSAAAQTTPAFGPDGEEVLAQLKARLEGAIRDEMAARK
jgi:Family of unknown function (DUF5681)